MGKTNTVHLPVFAGPSPGYDVDFCAWSEEQVRRLRLLRVPGLDVEHLAEEMLSLGRSDRREIASRVQTLLLHLLKYKCQPAMRTRSWLSSIREQRRRISSLLTESPSLHPVLGTAIADEYAAAIDWAVSETGLPERAFPTICEWTEQHILHPNFLPSG